MESTRDSAPFYTKSSPSSPSPQRTFTMGETTKIMRTSIHIFLRSYDSFTSIATILVFPAAASLLLSQSLTPSSSPTTQTISSRLHALFAVAGFPIASPTLSLLNLKLSQTITSFIFTLPFYLTFLILAKASIIERLLHKQCRYRPLLFTHIFNNFIVLSVNATAFSVLFIAFSAATISSLTNSVITISVAGAVIYSIVLAKTVVTCNLAVIVSAADGCSGHLAFLRACVLIRGRVRTALAIALPINLAMAAVECLFAVRVAAAYRRSGWISRAMASEGLMIGFIYSILMVVDVIMSCVFFQSCEAGRRRPEWEEAAYYSGELEPEGKVVIHV